ncbi:MAG: PDZ domain-containing protein [Chloroflexi bacterium]|nr:PDZ domain-containing protein [Chloroflexota bacterium]
MTTLRARVVIASLLGALLLVIAPLVSLASDAATPPPSSARPVAVSTVRQAYDLLLDQYVNPPAPATLLKAASQGIVERATEVEPGEWPGPTLSDDETRDDAWNAFGTWFSTVLTLGGPVLDRAGLEEAAIQSMALGLHENHTRYLNPQQYQEHEAWRRDDAHYAGIGARLRGSGRIVEVFEGSPAAAMGLRPGDRMLVVDGQPTDGEQADSIANRVRGPVGTSVHLLVERRGEPAPLDVTIERAEVRTATVSWKILPSATGRPMGYLRLRGFPELSVNDKVGAALEAMQAAGIDGLVIDLRGNGGGLIDLGVRIASRFVQDGVLFQKTDRAGGHQIVRTVGGYWGQSLPLVILVDDGTASMAEIFTSALREAGVAWVVGTRTRGSVAGARMFALPNGGGLQVTVLSIVSGQGAVLNDVGVEPDEVVEVSDDDLASGVDVQLQAALRHLDAVRQSVSWRIWPATWLGQALRVELAA